MVGEEEGKGLGGESVQVLSESVCPEVEFSFVDKIWPSFLQEMVSDFLYLVCKVNPSNVHFVEF